VYLFSDDASTRNMYIFSSWLILRCQYNVHIYFQFVTLSRGCSWLITRCQCKYTDIFGSWLISWRPWLISQWYTRILLVRDSFYIKSFVTQMLCVEFVTPSHVASTRQHTCLWFVTLFTSRDLWLGNLVYSSWLPHMWHQHTSDV